MEKVFAYVMLFTRPFSTFTPNSVLINASHFCNTVKNIIILCIYTFFFCFFFNENLVGKCGLIVFLNGSVLKCLNIIEFLI